MGIIVIPGRNETDSVTWIALDVSRWRHAHNGANAVGKPSLPRSSTTLIGPIDPSRSRQTFFAALDAAGLPRIRFQDSL
jgi:hypothetical protein